MIAYAFGNYSVFIGVDGTLMAQANLTGQFLTVGFSHRRRATTSTTPTSMPRTVRANQGHREP